MYDKVEDDFFVIKTTINFQQEYSNQASEHLDMLRELDKSNEENQKWMREDLPKFSYGQMLKMQKALAGKRVYR